MKKVILLVLLIPSLAYGQIMENFEPGNLNNWVQSPAARWGADTTGRLSGRFSMHHIFDNPEAGTDRIGIPVKNLHLSEGTTKWSFLIRHGYDPSSSNNWSVFLASDSDPSTLMQDGTTNGFAVGVNLTGYDDTLRLWKIKGSSITPVITSNINWQASIGISAAVKITVERSSAGVWILYAYNSNGALIDTSSGADNELFLNEWFELFYKYSSSRDRLLWFDDLKIEGMFYKDDLPPEVTACESSGNKTLRVTVSEPVADEFMITGNFKLDPGIISVVSVAKETALTYLIGLSGELINRSSYALIVSRLCDKDGNCVSDSHISFIPAWAGRGDVVITEIMADPDPPVYLPMKQYLEITNNTEFAFNLNNWKLIADSQEYLFPDSMIRPLGIIIVCAGRDTMLFSPYGKTIGLKQFPYLTIGGKILTLCDSYGNLIHGLEYSQKWYNDELKSNGGWSLELVDKTNPFYYDGNWKASGSGKGGTPGSANSVAGSNPDDLFYGLINVFPEDSTAIRLKFSEPLFNIEDKVESIKIDGISSAAITAVDPLYREFLVKPFHPVKRGGEHELVMPDDLEDFAGNRIQNYKYTFGLTEEAVPGDLLFNELLFNSLPGDPDYIELYNSSEKVIDASCLQVVSVNDGTSDTSQISQVSDERRCILPHSYYAFTTGRELISDRYVSSDPSCLFEVGSLPSMSDDKGHLVLFNRTLEKIDEVYYSESMQSVFLSGYDGVALEKGSPSDRSEEPKNWHSASESSGWGTPGAQNSVYSEVPASSDKVHLSSSKITPDSDGFEDFLLISFNLEGSNNVISVTVFDEYGNYIKKVASNMLAGGEASLTWDGTGDDASPVCTGIYIVFITLFDDGGKTERWKKVCTVIR